MTRKHTKRALLTSALALILCLSMLVGTTFAWFTDSVKSNVNRINAGNLDIELYVKASEGYAPIDTNVSQFTDSLWEPGHVEVVNLKIANLGTLALKYQFRIWTVSETPGTNQANQHFKLSDYIQYAIIDGEFTGNREAAVAEAAKYNPVKISSMDITYPGIMEASTTETYADQYVTLVVWMPESVGNEANYKTGTTPPQITLGIELLATQVENEDDSFGSDYDANAGWYGHADTAWYNTEDTEFTLTNAEQLAGLAQLVNEGTDTFVGKTVKLGANIDLNNVVWTPIGNNSDVWNRKFGGTFIGTGYTISNLKVSGTTGVGLFGYVGPAAHIEGVTIDGAYVTGNDYVGAVMGTGYLAENCLKNCTVMNATIIASPYMTSAGVYDGGAKAGAVAGYALNGNVTGNKAINCSVSAYRDLGGIVGMVNGENRAVTVSGNTIENVELSYVTVSGKYDGDKTNGNMDSYAGRISNATVAEDNSGEYIKSEVTAVMIYTADELFAFAADVNAGNTYKGMTVMLGANIDLANGDWTPIGNSTNKFEGTFDGNGYCISNLNVNMPGKSNVGLFGMTTNGAIQNLTIENATVVGRLNVGVVAGTPYTSKYSNITVKGDVKVEGMSYVGAVGGKNAYADWNNIVVDVNEGSYVKANSIENGTAYRSYVGGVIGFMGEGGHKVSNVTSNIDVYGTTCDVGGVVGIAHYGNSFENITCTGNVTITDAAEAADAEEIGGIAGVWNNGGANVTFTNCKFSGNLSVNYTEGVDLSNNTITGKAYMATGTGKLIIDGKEFVENTGRLDSALQAGEDVTMQGDMTFSAADTSANSGYGATGVKVDNCAVLDGAGNTLTVNDANGTWDCAVNLKSGTVKNLTINGAFRGIFMSGATGDVYIDNVTIDKVCYTFNSDAGNKDYGVYISNSTLNGWTSYSDVHKEVVFTNCKFGAGTGSYTYAFCRPYNVTEFKNCAFETGFKIDPRAAVTFENCTIGGVALTAENLSTLVTSNIANATVK